MTCAQHEADLAVALARVRELEAANAAERALAVSEGRELRELAAENKRLKERLAVLERDVTPSIELETELECISDVVTGRRPPEDFEPASGTLGEVIRALAAWRRAPRGGKP